MRRAITLITLPLVIFVIIELQGISAKANPGTSPANQKLTAKQQLGKKIFFDKNLSTPAGQACADCHAPEVGFTNPETSLPVSQGVYPDRFGKRNDLSAAYASFIPEFHYDAAKKSYIGGCFWDGRAKNLVEQAKGPFLNSLEMANPDGAAVVEKVRKADYVAAFKEVFGQDSLKDPNQAYNLIAEAIADYEKSSELNQFSSKYDLYVKGKVKLSEQELQGLALFEKKGNCAACHPASPGKDGTPALFSDFGYDNLGIPKNAESPYYYLAKSLNPDGVNAVDLGLGSVLKDPAQNGKFRTPSLRNAAKTLPYSHNGFFKTLRQIVAFYNTRDVGPWPPPEVPENVNRKDMGNLKLTEQEVDDIVAFLNTLTDGYSPAE
jgi:cytochrome c peroxidase